MIENKIKEYIEGARHILFYKQNTILDWKKEENILLVAQMLQREEHFNKTRD